MRTAALHQYAYSSDEKLCGSGGNMSAAALMRSSIMPWPGYIRRSILSFRVAF